MLKFVVGSRHTSDDSPTVTQTYLYKFTFIVCVGRGNATNTNNEGEPITEVNCNARHKDIKNKRILPQN